MPRLRKSSNPKKSLPNPFLEDFCQLLLGSSVLITWIHRLPKFVMWWHYTLTSNFFLNTNNKLNLSVRSLVVDWSLSCKADCTEERFWCRASQFSSGFDVRLNSSGSSNVAAALRSNCRGAERRQRYAGLWLMASVSQGLFSLTGVRFWWDSIFRLLEISDFFNDSREPHRSKLWWHGKLMDFCSSTGSKIRKF